MLMNISWKELEKWGTTISKEQFTQTNETRKKLATKARNSHLKHAETQTPLVEETNPNHYTDETCLAHTNQTLASHSGPGITSRLLAYACGALHNGTTMVNPKHTLWPNKPKPNMCTAGEHIHAAEGYGTNTTNDTTIQRYHH